MQDESYAQLAADISQEIKIGISEIAELHKPEIKYIQKICSKIPETLEEYALVLTDFCQNHLLDQEWYALEKELIEYCSQRCTKDLFSKDFLELVPKFEQLENPKKIIDHLYKLKITVKEKIEINILTKNLKADGFHFDYKNSLQNSTIFKFKLKNSYMYNQKHEFSNVLITLNTPFDNTTSIKTFFPNTWSPYEVLDFCFEHIKNAQIIEVNEKVIKLEASVDKNLSIFYVFNKLTYEFETIFPKIKK